MRLARGLADSVEGLFHICEIHVGRKICGSGIIKDMNNLVSPEGLRTQVSNAKSTYNADRETKLTRKLLLDSPSAP